MACSEFNDRINNSFLDNNEDYNDNFNFISCDKSSDTLRFRRASSHLPAGPIIPLTGQNQARKDLASTATSPKGAVTNEHQFTSSNSAKKKRSILAIFVYTAESSRRPNKIITSSLPPAFTDEESMGELV